jgi:hypothetical protein
MTLFSTISGFPEAGLVKQQNRAIAKKDNKTPLVRIKPKEEFFNLAPPSLKMLSQKLIAQNPKALTPL